MNSNSAITITLGDRAENHTGMQILGNMASAGQGFGLADLEQIQNRLEVIGIGCELIPLTLLGSTTPIDTAATLGAPDPAYILIIRDGVNKILQANPLAEEEVGTAESIFHEQISLEIDKKAWMRGRVVNKHARWNVCFDDVGQEPKYEKKKGRIISYNQIPRTNQLLKLLPRYFGPKAEHLKGEGNYYYDKTKCGIGFHGDSERRKVIGIRLGVGESPPLHYQWFRDSLPVGERIMLHLNGGDMYVMSEKAVGQDWKRKKIYTLRHATGCSKYTTILKKGKW